MNTKAASGSAGQPINDQSAERARLEPVNQNPRRGIIGTWPPAAAGKRIGGAETGLGARGFDVGRRAGGAVFDVEVVDPDASGAACARNDCDLNGAERCHDAPSGGSPRKFHLAARHFGLRPARRKSQILLDVPPDVLARAVHQFDLEIVQRTAAAQPQAQRIILGHCALDHAARDHEAAATLKVEIHPQRRAGLREFEFRLT